MFNSPLRLRLLLYKHKLKTKLFESTELYRLRVCVLYIHVRLLLLLLFTCHEVVKTWTLSFLFTLTSVVCVYCTAQETAIATKTDRLM